MEVRTDNPVSIYLKHKPLINKSWLVGYLEVNGNFTTIRSYSKEPDNIQFIHVFEISQLSENIVLEAILNTLGFPLNSINRPSNNSIIITKPNLISKIILYLNNTMKGFKSLEFKI
uniref:LAGLIDADG endonuclease n=1 Tax=Elmerina hispida TaxID=1245649 RepID=UPI003002B0DB|nr:LAGLIDADG endonuclease [Elmerina hispida]